ncbi:MAG TPA: serine/threonine-protein kinase [Steroidobacteraceae bacterium]|nr:serine/threonine-protein kinase [Steroidobacteraceae bacterium]
MTSHEREPRTGSASASADADATLLRASSAPMNKQSTRPEAGTAGFGDAPTEAQQDWEEPHDWSGVWQEAREGMVLKERYRLDKRVGEGGMGMVFRATDLESEGLGGNEVLAVKVLKSAFRTHPDALRALNEEVRKGRVLAHPNIVSAYSFNRDKHQVFMTMEFLDGKPLDALLDEEFARGMPFDRAWAIIEDVGSALAYAHDRGIVHSDFKPSNVFVLAGGRAKVLDFGIARAARGNRGSRFDAGDLGAMTPAYASCEMLENQPPDNRDDIYALGCVIYEMLSGKHPFARKNAVEARERKFAYRPIPALSKTQNRVLASTLAFERYKRADSVETVLRGLKEGARSDARRTGWMVAGGLALLVLGSGTWFGVTRFGYQDSDEKVIDSLIQPAAKVREDFDPVMVQTLLDQGNDYLAQGRKQFDPAILSEGVSTAVGAFRGVLHFDPANRQAAVGITEIFKIYRAQAKRYFQEKQYRKALEVTDIGLKIYPASVDLRSLRTQIQQRLYDSDAAAMADQPAS